MSNSGKQNQWVPIGELKYEKLAEEKDVKRRETLEEFLARGGSIKRCYKPKPQKWKETFNGTKMYKTRYGKMK